MHNTRHKQTEVRNGYQEKDSLKLTVLWLICEVKVFSVAPVITHPQHNAEPLQVDQLHCLRDVPFQHARSFSPVEIEYL